MYPWKPRWWALQCCVLRLVALAPQRSVTAARRVWWRHGKTGDWSRQSPNCSVPMFASSCFSLNVAGSFPCFRGDGVEWYHLINVLSKWEHCISECVFLFKIFVCHCFCFLLPYCIIVSDALPIQPYSLFTSNLTWSDLAVATAKWTQHSTNNRRNKENILKLNQQSTTLLLVHNCPLVKDAISTCLCLPC